MSDWKSDLANFFSEKEEKNELNEEKLKDTEAEVAKFYSKVVIPAFQELKVELEKYYREVRISSGLTSASIIVIYKGQKEIDYSIKVRIYPYNAFPYPHTRFRDESGKIYITEGFLRSGSQAYNISQIKKNEIIQHFLVDYKRSMRRS